MYQTFPKYSNLLINLEGEINSVCKANFYSVLELALIETRQIGEKIYQSL